MHEKQLHFPIIPTSVQWPEARGFHRLYGSNPRVQAALAKALLGYRATKTEFSAPDTEGQQLVNAIDLVLGSLAVDYPEFVQPTYKEEDGEFGGFLYEADPRLLELMDAVQSHE